MSGAHWKNRPSTDAYSILMTTIASFAEAAKREGDMPNYFRWRNVATEARLRGEAALLPKGDVDTGST